MQIALRIGEVYKTCYSGLAYHNSFNMISETSTMRLPSEIVYEILSYQFKDLMSNDHSATSEKYHSNIKTFLGSNSTVNRTFHALFYAEYSFIDI